MNILNGTFTYANGNIVIHNMNGQVNLGDDFSCDIANLEHYDKTVTKSCHNIDKVDIDSIAEVQIKATYSNEATVHLYGDISASGDILFDVDVVKRKLQIKVNYKGQYIAKKFRLDVTLPSKTFESIMVENSSANVTVDEGIAAEKLDIETKSGDIETKAIANNISIFSKYGNANLFLDAIQDVKINVSAKYGDVRAFLNNIGQMNTNLRTIHGDVRNRHKDGKGFTADVDIQTTYGDIYVR